MLTRRHLLAGAAAVAAGVPKAGAQANYASQPIHLLVGYAAGGGVDIVARLLQEPMKSALGQPIIIENRTGASAMLATGAVAKAQPDGYTLLACASGEVAINHFLFKERMSYDPAKELVPIALIGIVPCVVVVAAGTPVHNPKELIDYAKANPGKLSFASGNTAGIVAGETLKHWAGIDMLHVPYKSTPPALEDILGGRVSMMFADLTTAMPHVRAGTLLALTITRIKRSSLFPELPTMDEEGMTGFDLDAWAGIVAPARMPPEIVTRLNAELRRIIDDPAVKKRLTNVGFEAFSSSPEELGETIKVQLEKWGKMVADAGIKRR
jgi:tripartite-type tricarboxylate transporter receptor subunit TctC